MLGNLVAQTAASRHTELDVLRPVAHAAQRPINARICLSGLCVGVVGSSFRWLDCDLVC
jgi:hypothetical protein